MKAAGRKVTLDPATSIGNEWWEKTELDWFKKNVIPPSTGFSQARRTTIADADGKFNFLDIPSGKYYIRAEIIWLVGSNYQGKFVLVNLLKLKMEKLKKLP